MLESLCTPKEGGKKCLNPYQPTGLCPSSFSRFGLGSSDLLYDPRRLALVTEGLVPFAQTRCCLISPYAGLLSQRLCCYGSLGNVVVDACFSARLLSGSSSGFLEPDQALRLCDDRSSSAPRTPLDSSQLPKQVVVLGKSEIQLFFMRAHSSRLSDGVSCLLMNLMRHFLLVCHRVLFYPGL